MIRLRDDVSLGYHNSDSYKLSVSRGRTAHAVDKTQGMNLLTSGGASGKPPSRYTLSRFMTDRGPGKNGGAERSFRCDGRTREEARAALSRTSDRAAFCLYDLVVTVRDKRGARVMDISWENPSEYRVYVHTQRSLPSNGFAAGGELARWKAALVGKA